MDSRKALVVSIIKFLRSEMNGNQLGDEAIEGLEVSVQCLETAYVLEGVTPPENEDLLEIYEKSIPASTPPPTSEAGKQAAEVLKQEGNNLMKVEKYGDAISAYTSAIQVDGQNAVYYCNRAAAYTKLDNNTQAIADCKKALTIDSKYGKAYGRMGLAYLTEKEYKKSVDSYEKAVELEPSNASYLGNLNIAKEQLKATTTQPQGGPGAAPNNPLAGLDISSLLSNPAVRNMAQNFMQNPAMQNMFANMMGGMGGPPPTAGQVNENPDNQDPDSEMPTGMDTGGLPEGLQMPAGLDFGNIINATQQMAEQLRTENPELADSLRQQFQEGQHPPDSSNPEGEKKE